MKLPETICHNINTRELFRIIGSKRQRLETIGKWFRSVEIFVCSSYFLCLFAKWQRPIIFSNDTLWLEILIPIDCQHKFLSLDCLHLVCSLANKFRTKCSVNNEHLSVRPDQFLLSYRQIFRLLWELHRLPQVFFVKSVKMWKMTFVRKFFCNFLAAFFTFWLIWQNRLQGASLGTRGAKFSTYKLFWHFGLSK